MLVRPLPTKDELMAPLDEKGDTAALVPELSANTQTLSLRKFRDSRPLYDSGGKMTFLLFPKIVSIVVHRYKNKFQTWWTTSVRLRAPNYNPECPSWIEMSTNQSTVVDTSCDYE